MRGCEKYYLNIAVICGIAPGRPIFYNRLMKFVEHKQAVKKMNWIKNRNVWNLSNPGIVRLFTFVLLKF